MNHPLQEVYALSAKGQQERNAQHPILPKELAALLRLVDGQRSAAELVAAAAGKSAVMAGGLRWLKASGYLQTVQGARPSARTASPNRLEESLRTPTFVKSPVVVPVAVSVPAPVSAPASMPVPAAPANTAGVAMEEAAPSAPVKVSYVGSDDDACRILADYMVQSIRRHLGEGGYVYRRQIERASSAQELVPHLNPLIDAIVLRAGPDAGAEFAETAAFILKPQDRDVTLR
jgi:hypothetical protein